VVQPGTRDIRSRLVAKLDIGPACISSDNTASLNLVRTVSFAQAGRQHMTSRGEELVFHRDKQAADRNR
jgi:hypothetical protein